MMIQNIHKLIKEKRNKFLLNLFVLMSALKVVAKRQVFFAG